jgi:RHS repeat-associated protein
VLLTGGQDTHGPVDAAWLMDSAGIPARLPHGLVHARAFHTATVLPDGTVLLLGGIGADGVAETKAEAFTLATLSFAAQPVDVAPRAHHTATLLLDGRVLLAGGDGATSASVDYLDATSKAKVGELTLKSSRHDHTATLFADGTVHLWSGADDLGQPFTFGESIDPITSSSRFEATNDDPAAGQPMRVEASLPADHATDVSVDTRVALRFSRPIEITSLTPASLVLSGPNGTISLTVTPAEAGMLAFAQPRTSLDPGTEYSIAVAGITDGQGGAFAPTQLTFTTAGDPPENAKKKSDTDDNGSAEHLPPLQAPPGVTAVSGRALTLNGKPLQGVTFRIDDRKTQTDGTGRFLLTNIPAGHHELVIDGRSVRAAETYGVFEVGVDVADKTTTVLGYTVWMTALDMAHAVSMRFPTATETVLTTPLLPGLELRLPAGTTITDIDGNVASQVSITPIPVKQPPFPLPGGVDVPIYFTIQPGGGYIHVAGGGYRGAQLFYPNTKKDRPGTPFNFWNYDAEDKGWFIYGAGVVSADRTTIIPNAGVEIHELTGAMVGLGGFGPPSGRGGDKQAGDPVDPSTGLFVYEKTDLSVADIVPIAVTRTYRQGDSRSRGFGIGTSFNYDMFLVGDISSYTYQELILPDGGRVRFNRIFEGDLGFMKAIYQNTSTLGEWFGATITYCFGWCVNRKDGTVFRFKEAFSLDGPRDTGLLSITDRNGNVVTVTRLGGAANGNVDRVTSPNGRYIQFTYDDQHRITQLQDNIGRTVTYTYDSPTDTGRLTQVTDVNNGIWIYTYDTAHQMTSIRDARDILYLQNEYDANGRVMLQTQADDSTYEFEYTTDANGAVTQTDITDPRGNVRRLVFNPPPTSPNGFMAGGTDSTDTYAYGTSIASTTTTVRQPGTNLPSSIIDNLGRVTAYTYDVKGNVLTVTRLSGTPDAATMLFTYDSTFGNLASVRDPLGRTTTFAYDTHGNLTSTIDPLGNRTTWTYNAAGQVQTVTDANGNTTTNGYTAGNLTSITDPLGRSVTFSYDGAGRRTGESNAYGTTLREYNLLDLVTRITDPASGITDFTYDPNGNLLTIKDGRNNTTTYTYNNMERLETRKDALLATEVFMYDGNGNVAQATDRRGKVTTYEYDALNRPSFVGFGTQAGPTYESSVTFTYDGASRLTLAADSETGNVAREYDEFDRLANETTPQGIVTYEYDSIGRRTATTVTGQPTTTYTYDDANRITQIAQNTSTVNLTYDAGGRRSSVTLPNGVMTRYTYNASSQITGLTYDQPNLTLGNLVYTYDSVGRRTGLGGTLAQIDLPASLSSATYNANNQLTMWDATTFTYDANGNLANDSSRTYSWNARNELSSLGGSVTASFSYDPFGRRTSKSIGGVGTTYLYDGANIIQELSGSTPTANLLRGETDEVFVRADGASISHFLADALGSSVALTDTTGTIQGTYRYQPFGTTASSGSVTNNGFQFTGRENDGTGLYYYRARYYAPGRQRFLSEDPIDFGAGDANLYVYSGNDPINKTDPSGLYAGWDDVAFAGGGAVAGLVGQAVGDMIAGRVSCWTDYAGAAFGGAATGVGLLYGGPVAAGALGGMAASGMTQFLNNQFGYQSGYDAKEIFYNGVLGGGLGFFGSLSYPGLTTGRNSYNAIFNQMRTKLQKGTISKLRPQTAAKMFAGNAAATGLFPGAIVGSAIGQVRNAASMTGRGCGCQ